MRSVILTVFVFALVSGCEQSSDVAVVSSISEKNIVTAPNENQQKVAVSEAAPAQRQALFGDLHLHTGWSFDAWGMSGIQTTPFEAYQFARGEKIEYMGRIVQKKQPLDFVAITDHAEYLSVLSELDDPESAFSTSEFGIKFREHPFQAFIEINKSFTQGKKLPEFDYLTLMTSAWEHTIEAANKFNEPGKFTALIGYEWTSMPEGKYNLHRNVIFKGNTAPKPFDASMSQRPEDLWTYMELQRQHGYELLAIPHNSNASGGFMFEWTDSKGAAISKDYAERRKLNEPLVEIFQGKGQSESIPSISPNDEFANFEVLETLLTDGAISTPAGSYARDALGRGLIIKNKTGVNPYAFGVIGSSDFHNGLSTSAEVDFAGKNLGVDIESGMVDKETAARNLMTNASSKWEKMGKSLSDIVRDKTIVGSAGLAGVWAEENTRESIFNALERKEAFATSGTRIRIRFFGGWDYDDSMLDNQNWLENAYSQGVPMGGELHAKSRATSNEPRFIVWAIKDPDGANLDRIQIVKVWQDGDGYQEKIYDVVLSDNRKADSATGKITPVGNTVNLETASYENTIGDIELGTIWHDPDFNLQASAVYYARAIEIPTPRWTTLLARHFDLPLPDNGRPTLQERAISSPIWYQPE